jgi:hypothetical protein
MKLIILACAGGLLGFLGDQVAFINPEYAYLIGILIGGFVAMFGTIVGNQ